MYLFLCGATVGGTTHHEPAEGGNAGSRIWKLSLRGEGVRFVYTGSSVDDRYDVFFSSQKQQGSNWTEAVVSTIKTWTQRKVNSGTYFGNLVRILVAHNPGSSLVLSSSTAFI